MNEDDLKVLKKLVSFPLRSHTGKAHKYQCTEDAKDESGNSTYGTDRANCVTNGGVWLVPLNGSPSCVTNTAGFASHRTTVSPIKVNCESTHNLTETSQLSNTEQQTTHSNADLKEANKHLFTLEKRASYGPTIQLYLSLIDTYNCMDKHFKKFLTFEGSYKDTEVTKHL